MTEFWYAREIPIYKDEFDRALHRIVMPARDEKGWYNAVRSASSFRSGKQADVDKALREAARDTCGWDHRRGVLYVLKSGREHEIDMESMLGSMERINAELGKDLREKFAKVPVIDHASLHDFFRHIRFDRKRRCYGGQELNG